MAETFLYHMRRHYIGVRAELYSDIAVRLEAEGMPPPHETLPPLLPADLVDVPAHRSLPFARALPEVERPEETWVVWVDVGWYDLTSYIDTGSLPPAAASWPPLKREMYMIVDARTGEVRAKYDRWLFAPGMLDPDMRAYGDHALKEAAIRAAHWLAKSSPAAPRRPVGP